MMNNALEETQSVTLFFVEGGGITFHPMIVRALIILNTCHEVGQGSYKLCIGDRLR